MPRCGVQASPTLSVATEQELNDFLAGVEKRAFKRCLFQVRDDEAALDIVQDSMMKLAEHYGDKPVAELPMLFQRILSNSTLDWFRRQKTRSQVMVNFSDLRPLDDESDLEPLDAISNEEASHWSQSGEKWLQAEKWSGSLNKRYKTCQRVNEKPSCCVIGRNWTLLKPPPPWVAPRAV